MSGQVSGVVFFENGLISVVSIPSATIRFKFSDVLAFEYIESREWGPPPVEGITPPTSSLVCHLSAGYSVALHELADDIEK